MSRDTSAHQAPSLSQLYLSAARGDGAPSKDDAVDCNSMTNETNRLNREYERRESERREYERREYERRESERRESERLAGRRILISALFPRCASEAQIISALNSAVATLWAGCAEVHLGARLPEQH